MTTDNDTNALAFSKLQALVDADASLPDAVKKALVVDLASAPQTAANLRKYFEPKDAPAK